MYLINVSDICVTRFCPWWSAMARHNHYWLLTDHKSYLYDHYFRHYYTLVHYLE